MNISYFLFVYIQLYFYLVKCQNLPQIFVFEPGNQTAVLGERTVLSCRVINKAGTIQWTRDGFGLGIEKNLNAFPRYTMIGNELEGDYSLEINPVQLEDDGYFQCQVTANNGVAGIRSRSAFLTVFVAPDPPIIVQGRAQGDIMRTTSGTVVELTCESNGGKPAPEIQWFYSDGTALVTKNITQSYQILSDGKRINTESKLTFIANKDYDNKTIVCRSENSAIKEPLTASIRLDVKYAPEVVLKVVEPIGQIITGDTVVISCEATANPNNQLLYKWFKNEEIIVGDHNTRLTLTAVDRHMNAAIIACEVSNSVGVSKTVHTLDVSFGPIMKTEVDQVYGVELNRDVRLKCEAEGNPKPDITWLKFGKTDVLSSDSELLVKSVNQSKTGKYICRASVKGFPEMSIQQFVAINGPPQILKPYTHYGLRGETVKIGCAFESTPKPSQILWYHNRQILNTDSILGVTIINDRIPGESTLRSTVVIQHSKISDFGEYNCTVWNLMGTDSKIIILHEQLSFTYLVTIVSILLSILVSIVLITIIIILYLRHQMKKQIKQISKSKISLSSTDSTDSGDESTDSELSNADSVSRSEMDVSETIEEPVPQQKRQFYSNDILLDFDLNQSFRQYL